MRLVYCHPLPVWMDNIFPHFLIDGTIFGGGGVGVGVGAGEMVLSVKFVFILRTILSEVILILRIIHRGMTVNVHWSLCKVPVFIARL